MKIEYKDLSSGFEHKVTDFNDDVLVFIHAEYEDKAELVCTLFRLINMVIDDEL